MIYDALLQIVPNFDVGRERCERDESRVLTVPEGLQPECAVDKIAAFLIEKDM